MTTGERMKARRKEIGISVEEIASALNVSIATIYRYENGDIEKVPGTVLDPLAKVLRTTPSYLMGWDSEKELPSGFSPMPSTYKVPRLGRIPCGSPNIEDEVFETYDDVPDYIKADFTLECDGDSMIGARIHDGDIVCIHKDAEIRSGDIAAVRVDGGKVTLKRIRIFDDHIVLQPENPDYKPLSFWEEEMNTVQIIGKATHFISVVR